MVLPRFGGHCVRWSRVVAAAALCVAALTASASHPAHAVAAYYMNDPGQDGGDNQSVDGQYAYWSYETWRHDRLQSTFLMRRILPDGRPERLRIFSGKKFGAMAGLRARNGRLTVWFTKGGSTVDDRGWDQRIFSYDPSSGVLTDLNSLIFPGNRGACGYEIAMQNVDDDGEAIATRAQPVLNPGQNPCRASKFVVSTVGVSPLGAVRVLGSQLVTARNQFDREGLMRFNYRNLPIVVEGDYAVYFDPANDLFFQPGGSVGVGQPEEDVILRRLSDGYEAKVTPGGTWTGEVSVSATGKVLFTSYEDRDNNGEWTPEAHLFPNPEQPSDSVQVPAATRDERDFILCGEKALGFSSALVKTGRGRHERFFTDWRVRQLNDQGAVVRDTGRKRTAADFVDFRDCDANTVAFSSDLPEDRRQPNSGLSKGQLLPDYWRYYTSLK